MYPIDIIVKIRSPTMPYFNKNLANTSKNLLYVLKLPLTNFFTLLTTPLINFLIPITVMVIPLYTPFITNENTIAILSYSGSTNFLNRNNNTILIKKIKIQNYL